MVHHSRLVRLASMALPTLLLIPSIASPYIARVAGDDTSTQKPLYAHNITIGLQGRDYVINITDLKLSINATCPCSSNTTCQQSPAVNITISQEIVFQNDTTKIVRIYININGTKYNYTITTKIYTKAWSDEETYRNITMISQKIETENISRTTYILYYNVTNLAGEYRLLITTTLKRSANNDSYERGFTSVIHKPSREHAATLELVSFNSTPTLSQHSKR